MAVVDGSVVVVVLVVVDVVVVGGSVVVVVVVVVSQLEGWLVFQERRCRRMKTRARDETPITRVHLIPISTLKHCTINGVLLSIQAMNSWLHSLTAI